MDKVAPCIMIVNVVFNVVFLSTLKYLDTLYKKFISLLIRTNVGRSIYRVINMLKNIHKQLLFAILFLLKKWILTDTCHRTIDILIIIV